MAFIQRKQVAPSSHKTISSEEAKLISSTDLIPNCHFLSNLSLLWSSIN